MVSDIMTAIECLKCEDLNKDECWCYFYEDYVNEDYKGFCNCYAYWGNDLEEMDRSELWDIIIELLKINENQIETIDSLKEACKKTDKSREFWVKKYNELMNEIIKGENEL